MKWTDDAEAAVKRVPFFVRKRVRARIEEEARDAGKTRVSAADVDATRARYLKSMASEVKGYRIETCFGPNGCPNRVNDDSQSLADRIESLVLSEDLPGFLRAQVGDRLKFHHEFRVSVADCPNACSQPQIRDIGIIGACAPATTDAPCTDCRTCGETCREGAIGFPSSGGPPAIDMTCCLACGQCLDACPTGTLAPAATGYRILLGGKLGRHPRLARELPGIFSADEVLAVVRDCLADYKRRSRGGRRFAELFTDEDFERLANRFGKP